MQRAANLAVVDTLVGLQKWEKYISVETPPLRFFVKKYIVQKVQEGFKFHHLPINQSIRGQCHKQFLAQHSYAMMK